MLEGPVFLGAGDKTQVLRLAQRTLYQVNHFTSPILSSGGLMLYLEHTEGKERRITVCEMEEESVRAEEQEVWGKV